MRRPLLAVLLLSAITASPVLAQRWGYPGDARYGWNRGLPNPTPDRTREGQVEATRFLADGAAAQALGHGSIAVSAATGGVADDRERATYEAAVIDRLASVGYDTASRAGDGGQTVELQIRHAELAPPEARRNPLSGEMAVGVSSRGGSYQSLGIGIDLRKPRKALMSTRLDARIRDRSGAVLWEGRADIATRAGDPRWTDQAIAAKLAATLFSGFPGKNGETIRG